MKATTLKECEPRPSKSSKKCSVEEIKALLKKRYIDVKGRIDIRFLWTNEDVHRFRVNWWIVNKNEPSIYTSKFVLVCSSGKVITERNE